MAEVAEAAHIGVAPPAYGLWWSRVAFALAVFIVLVFSNGWEIFVLGPDRDPQASVLIRALYTPAYIAAVILLLATPGDSLMNAIRAPTPWLMVLIALASVVWSIDPGMTQRRGVALLFTTLGALAIATRYDWPAFSEVLAAAFGILAVICLLLGLLVPSWGRMTAIFPGAWCGVWSEKNALGDHMALGFIIGLAAAALNRHRRWLWLGVAGLCLLLILLSTSKTSLVCAACGLAAFGLVVLARRGPACAVVATFVGVTGFLALIAVALFASDAVLGLLGKDASLTGRTKVWDPVIRQAQLRPWTGYGYGSVWDDTSLWGPLAWITKGAGFKAREAHNSWLEQWISLGYIGLSVWCLYFLETWVRAIYAFYRLRGAYLVFPLLVIFTLMTPTESVVANYNDFTWVIFAGMTIRLANSRRTAADAAPA